MHKVKTGDGKDDDLYHLMLKQNNDHIVMKNQFVEMKNYIPFINLVNIPSMEIKFKGYKYQRILVLIILTILRITKLIKNGQTCPIS